MVQKIIILQTVGTNNVVTKTVKIFVDLVKPGEVLMYNLSLPHS